MVEKWPGVYPSQLRGWGFGAMKHNREAILSMKLIKCSVATFIIALACAVRIRAQDPFTNGLVAYYQLNGNGNDASGNGKNGAVVGSTGTFGTDRFGQSFHSLILADGAFFDCGV